MGNFRFLTAGESHGQCLTAIVEGLPAGLKIDINEINRDLARRQQGYGRGGRMKIETDKADIISGVRFAETMGDPITLRIVNRDWQNWTERMSVFGEEAGEKVTAVRPGHADLTGILKYDRNDARDILERASARETAARVAVGALCKEFLAACGIQVVSQVVRIGGISVNEANIDRSMIGKGDSELNCYDSVAEELMKKKIQEAMANGDTLGGVFEVIVRGAPLGLGSHIQWDKRLDGKLAWALMAIQAIKGVEIGAGFKCGDLPGSQIHDEMFLDSESRVYRKTNRAGGLEGGMTNGEEISVKACMKPIPTLMQPLNSVDIKSKSEVSACKERSDVCAVSAASVVGEAMTAIIMTEAMLDKFGCDAMVDILEGLERYRQRVQGGL
ncbi:MAG: chorismate synthase [Anaerovibrio sp.]|uniref:chorismate synthase n=1 Tax=Anaerovibrio sp. TaxID=1872532 RepID=UPI0025F21E46|nr:chorismate synthase [Anaerovibrio sp.]MCR5177281.1 chorismate synthase [Anaerovibrio sp.]